MAGKIKGLKIKIDGESTGLNSELNKVKKNGQTINNELKNINRQLKFNPESTVLLNQKQQVLAESIENTKKQLSMLEEVQDQVKEKYASGEIDSGQYREFERELEYTQNRLKTLEKQSNEVSQALAEGAEDSTREVDKLNDELEETEKTEKKIDGSGLDTLKAGALGAVAAVAAVGTAAVGVVKKSTEIGSTFYAVMSRVEAISGATKDELEKLENKAKQVGETTKFSATQAAQALEYMAMAGWKPIEMLEGLDGVINAAAASGEDLANVSDIITDGLTAFGLSAKDSTYFADLLAKTSASSNTTIGMLGESFKNVAATAGAMRYSVNDTTFALGLMANAGIKGGSAGTALNSVFTRLAKPTKEVKTALSDLSIEAVNADGSMKPFSVLLPELRAKFDSLSESEKGQYATMIAGKNAMSGFLTLVNASQSDYDKLKSSIDNANGSAMQMSEIMQDNLQGDITILKSGIEGLGIQIYDSFDEGLRKSAKNGQTAINEISKALKNPSTQKSLDKINDAMAYGSKRIGELVAKSLPKLIDGLAFVTDHTEELTTATVTCVTAIVAYKVVGTITNLIKGMTTAQTALNAAMKDNPVGFLFTGLSLLAGAAVAAYNETTKLSESEKKILESSEEINAAVSERAEAYENAKKARDELLSNNVQELDYYSKLWDEMHKLVDENGNIISGYEDRVKYIAENLEEGLGIEIKINDGVIESYQKLQKEIEKTILKKRASFVIENEEEAYKEAIKNKSSAEQGLKEAENKKNEADANYKEAKQNYDDFIKKYPDDKNHGMLNNFVSNQKIALDSSVKAAKKARDDANNAYKTQKDLLENYYSDIAIYNTDLALFTSGSADDLEKISNRVSSTIIKDGEKVTLSTKQNVENAQLYYDWVLQEYLNGNANVSFQMLRDAKHTLDEAKKEHSASLSTMEETTEETADEIVDTSKKAKDGVAESAKEATAEVVDGVKTAGSKANAEAESLGRDIVRGMVQGMHQAQREAEDAMTTVINGVFVAGKVTAEVQSPSKRAKRELGVYLPKGVAQGILEAMPEAVGAMEAGMDSIFDIAQNPNYQHDIDIASRSINYLSNQAMSERSTMYSDAMLQKFDQFQALFLERMDRLEKRTEKIMLNGKVLVGELLPDIDEGLGGLVS